MRPGEAQTCRPGRLRSMAGLLCILAACSAGTDTPGPAGTGGSPAGDAGRDQAAPFVGTWSVVSGTVTVTCPNGFTDTSPVTSPDVFSRGVSSDLVLAGVCPETFAISGATAAAAPAGQECYDPATQLTTTLTAHTFTTSDGRIGQEAASGRVAGLRDSTTGQALTCTVVESATYQKIAN
jgi:hypothetical protein